MARRLLVVHESHFIRKIVNSYALSELGGIVVEKADYASLGLKLIQEKEYDIILSALEMAGMNGLELFRQSREKGLNKKTPFVIMTSTDDPDNHERIKKKGITHILRTPFSASQLAKAVDAAASPRDMRKYQRYSILGTEAEVWMNERSVYLKILNISLEGMMGEVQYLDQLVAPWSINRIYLSFPDEFGLAKAGDLQGVICRVEVISWRTDNLPDIMRIAWRFTHVPEAAKQTLEMVLDRAEKNYRLSGASFDI